MKFVLVICAVVLGLMFLGLPVFALSLHCAFRLIESRGTMSNMKATFSFEAGILVRKEVVFQLTKAARLRGLAIGIIDDGGWFHTEYCVTVDGDEHKVKDYLQAVKKWVTELSAG